MIELHVLLGVLLIDLGVSAYALWRSFHTERQLHAAIKHPVRLHGQVK